MIRKSFVLFVVALAGGALCAGPCGRGRDCGRDCGRRCPPPPAHHDHDGWGRGGRDFWPGFVGGAVAGLAAAAVAEPTTVVVASPTVVTTPAVAAAPVVVQQPVVQQAVVVQQPVYQTQNVWVEGRYVDTVQANGAVIRTWNPGHYEQRTVQVQ